MPDRQVTNEELIARVEACQEKGNTLGGGAVAPEAVAEALLISESTAAEYLRRLAKRDAIEPTWGFDDGKQRRGYRPIESDEETRRVMADGGQSSSGIGQLSSFISTRNSLPHRQPSTFDLRFISPVRRRKAGYKAPHLGQKAVTSSIIARSINYGRYVSTVYCSFLSRTFQSGADRPEGADE